MRLFAMPLAPGERGHDAAYALLRRAVREVWGVECPEIRKTPEGRPFFAERPELCFSLSHTRSHVLVGLSEQPLGVDAETLRPVPDRLRERLFTPEERREFTFFEGWTLREAVFKLTGSGSLMSMPLSRGEDGGIVTPCPGVRCRLYSDLPGCAAAVACYDGTFPDRIEVVERGEFV